MKKHYIYATLVVLVIVIAVCVVRYRRKHCSTDADCAAPNVCRSGACVPQGAGFEQQPATMQTCEQNHAVRNIRMMEGAGSLRPGACVGTADKKWSIISDAWVELPGSEIVGGPKQKMTNEACQRFCEEDPSCVTWVNNPDSYCHAYTVYPGALVGNPSSTTGIKNVM